MSFQSVLQITRKTYCFLSELSLSLFLAKLSKCRCCVQLIESAPGWVVNEGRWIAIGESPATWVQPGSTPWLGIIPKMQHTNISRQLVKSLSSPSTKYVLASPPSKSSMQCSCRSLTNRNFLAGRLRTSDMFAVEHVKLSPDSCGHRGSWHGVNFMSCANPFTGTDPAIAQAVIVTWAHLENTGGGHFV